MIDTGDGLGFSCHTYKPQQNTPVKSVLFFISSFKTPVTLYLPFIRALNKRGHLVYAYDYRSAPLLRTTPENWVAFSRSLIRDIDGKIKHELTPAQQKTVGIIGVSVGAVITIHTAKAIPALKKVMLVNPYGSNAEQVWTHRSLRSMKQALEKREITKAMAREVFGDLEPAANVHALNGKDILLFTNRYNHVIRYDNALLFINALKQKQVPFQLVTTNIPRHSLANYYALGQQKRWLSLFSA